MIGELDPLFMDLMIYIAGDQKIVWIVARNRSDVTRK
jgi:hypothetical protein